MGLRTTSGVWSVPEKYGPHGELFFFLIKKVPFALTKAVVFKPFVLAETLKASALIGLHLLAAESASGSVSLLGRHVKIRLPKKATANRGPKVKAFLRPIFASTMWKALR